MPSMRSRRLRSRSTKPDRGIGGSEPERRSRATGHAASPTGTAWQPRPQAQEGSILVCSMCSTMKSALAWGEALGKTIIS